MADPRPAPARAEGALPSPAHIDRRLAQMLAADSARTGAGKTARLMLMLTRSCELRCAYCFVALREDEYGTPHDDVRASGGVLPGEIPRGDLSVATARRAVDRLMTSARPQLGLQLFGGEPSRRWDTLVAAVDHAATHPDRAGRALEILLTTNGLGLDAARLAELRGLPIVVQLSLDGWGAANRFRRPHLVPDDEAARRWSTIAETLSASGHRWFLNVTVPPAAAPEVLARYHEARAMGVPALQLNYATGMRWSPDTFYAWLGGLAAVLRHDAADPGPMALYNWQNGADPAPLCGDTICDVDGTLLQVGAIFHEKRFPALRAAYHHGHLDGAEPFDTHRATLADLWARTRAALSTEDAEVFHQGMRLGAGQDLVARVVTAEVGRPPFRG
ncbi:MAG: radical SAM protein [Pseudomonadota bacterium]|nr:radical SAM protein [Pseudomonadota bacterium]